MTRIAIYDMDKTITRRPTYTLFLIFAALRIAPLRLLFMPAAGGVAVCYGLRLISRAQLKELAQLLLIGDHVESAKMVRIAALFARHTLATNVMADARAAIDADRAAGCTMVLATASYEFYAAAIGTALGFEHVIATRSAVDDMGRIPARIVGYNCYGNEKFNRVIRWLEDTGLDPESVSFYSDHVSDAPLFEWATDPVAVNPNGPLESMARSKGWPIRRWA